MAGTPPSERLRYDQSGCLALQRPDQRDRNEKIACVAIGTDLDVKKEVLGIWFGASESTKYRLSVLNGLKSRGVQDILVTSVDGLSGFVEAINAAYPKTEVPRRIIHQFRSSTRYASYKDIKQFTADSKPVYKASAKDSALTVLGEFKVKWGEKYPLTVKS